MIINHTYKFVFIHVPKAAGTSVSKSLSTLSRYCDQEIGGTALGEAAQAFFSRRFGLRKHSRAEDVMAVMTPEIFFSYFRFAFVRNPYTRLTSTYYFLKNWSGLPPSYREQLDRLPTLNDFLLSGIWTRDNKARGPDGIFSPQTFWLYSSHDRDTPLVEFIGRMENIEHDLQVIFERIGAPRTNISLEHANKSPEYLRPSDWNPAIVDRIIVEYQQDFKRFGYSEDPP